MSRSPRLAVTGANGFVGRHVLAAGLEAGLEPVGLVRSEPAALAVAAAGGEARRIPALAAEPLAAALAGCDAVVHLAQIGAERGGATYQAVNVEGTRAVIAACRSAGVGRVVYFSGLGVARYGRKRRCTNPYFLSKLEAELALFRSGLEVVVFRPSYVLGPGGELVGELLRELAQGEVEWIGDGGYRMQPIAVRDAGALAVAAAGGASTGRAAPQVLDLVGPEAVSYAGFVERVALAAAARGHGGGWQARPIPETEADARAAAGGYRGLLPDELDCLLCDEVADPAPLAARLGRPLLGLDAAIAAAVEAALVS